MGPGQAFGSRHRSLTRGLYFIVQEPSGYSQIDRVIPRRQPREMTDHVHFAHFREVFDSWRVFPAPSADAGSTAGTSSGGS